MNNGESKQYPIDVDLSSRPIRIVFLVPGEENEISHLILDAIFRAGYAAWNGGYYLVVPVAAGSIPDVSYQNWIRAIDPDWIYSYVDLPESYTNDVNMKLCPMEFFRHRVNESETPLRSYDFEPNYNGLNTPLSSQTCLFDAPRLAGSAFPTLLGTLDVYYASRFISDNFGLTRFQRDISGLCAVTLLCPADLPASHGIGAARIHDDHAIVAAIREGRLTSSAELARAVRTGQPAIRDFAHDEALFLTVGDTVLDRIDAWNRRLLISEYIGFSASIRMSMEELSNGTLSYEVAQLLLRPDYGSRMRLHLCSRSHDETAVSAALGNMTGRLAGIFRSKARWSSIPAYPNEERVNEACAMPLFDEGATTIIHKPEQELQLPRPQHIHHLPPSYGSLNHGAWITDAHLGRHESTRTAINVNPRWRLPRRPSVPKLITKSPARIERHGRISILAHVDGFRQSEQEPLRTASITSPQMVDILNHAIVPHVRHSTSGQYSATPQWGRNLSVSDKGQHLQGVVTLFGGLEQAGKFVENSHWRALLTASRDQTGRQIRWPADSVHIFPNHQVAMGAIVSAYRINHADAKTLLRAKVQDALESFLQHRIVHRGHEWRCEYCGNVAMVGIGKLAESMSCDICGLAYQLPLDLKFLYTWNDFLYQALIKDHGLPVLWAIAQVRQQSRSCFAWMPEALIDWNDETNNEIDFLAICDGEIIAGEVKSAADMFLQDDPNGLKFGSILKKLGVDAGVLALERIGRDQENLPQLRQDIERVVSAVKISTGIPITLLIAEDAPDFQGPPIDFGDFGAREQHWHRK